MNKLFTLSLLVKAIDQLTAPVRMMRRAVEGLDDVAKRAKGLAQWGQQAAMAGALVGAMSATMLAGFAGPVKAAMQFEAVMSSVQAVSNASAADLKLLSDQAKMLGATTAFSASQAAEGQRLFAQAGLGVQEILQAMPAALALSKAGNMDLAAAVEMSTDTMHAFGLAARDLPHISDIMAATATSASLNLSDLKESLKYVAANAKGAGVSIEQASAMIGILADAGIKSSMGGTTLTGILNQLAAPAGKGASALAALGVATVDGAGNIRNYQSILMDLSKSLEGMGSGRKMAYLSEIFGTEAIKGVLGLMDAAAVGTLTERTNKLVSDVNGAATHMADVMQDNLAGDLTSFSSATEGLFITLGDTVTPLMRELAQVATGLVRSINAWAQQNPGLAKGLMMVVGGLGGILAVAAPVLLLSGTLATTFGIMGTGAAALLKGFMLLGNGLKFVATGIRIISLALTANPIGLLIAGIALAAGLIYAYWEPIKGFFIGLWNGVAEFFSGFSLFDAGARILSTLWDGMKSMATRPAELMGDIVGAVRDFLPFSPAKVGPLKDLNRIRLVETVAETMKPAPMVKAMRAATAATVLAASGMPAMAAPLERPAGAVGGAAAGGITIHQEITVTVQGGGSLPPEFQAQLQAGFKGLADDLIREIEARTADARRRDF